MSSKVEKIMSEAKPWLQRAYSDSRVPWTTAVLDLDTLNLFRIDVEDGGYQRPLSEARVDDLEEKFDAGEAREIWVSERADGSRWILDGQHTWAVLKRKGYTQWPTRVFFNLSIPEEARRFAEYQSNTRKIPGVVQFNAEVIAKDPTAVALDRILTDFYLRISSSKLRYKDNYLGVNSRAVFQKIYELGGEYTLREVLQLAIDSWGQSTSSFLGRVLQGMGYLFVYSESAQFDRGRFVAVLKNTTPKQLLEAIGPTGSGGASRSGALLLLEKYLDGVGDYAKIRHNSKDAPKLPDMAPKEGAEPKDPALDGPGIWIPGTENDSRTPLNPIKKPEKPSKPVEIDIAQAKANEAMEAEGVIEEVVEVAIVTPEEALLIEGSTEVGTGDPEDEDEDWEYSAPEGVATASE